MDTNQDLASLEAEISRLEAELSAGLPGDESTVNDRGILPDASAVQPGAETELVAGGELSSDTSVDELAQLEAEITQLASALGSGVPVAAPHAEAKAVSQAAEREKAEKEKAEKAPADREKAEPEKVVDQPTVTSTKDPESSQSETQELDSKILSTLGNVAGDLYNDPSNAEALEKVVQEKTTSGDGAGAELAKLDAQIAELEAQLSLETAASAATTAVAAEIPTKQLSPAQQRSTYTHRKYAAAAHGSATAAKPSRNAAVNANTALEARAGSNLHFTATKSMGAAKVVMSAPGMDASRSDLVHLGHRKKRRYSASGHPLKSHGRRRLRGAR